MTHQTTILVVDDEEAVRRVIAALLELEGYVVIQAENGAECLRMAYDYHPDLILLDIMMPIKDGRVVCRQLREVSDTPIIMLTALGGDRERVERLNDGADDYINKPFNNDELVARVRAVLRRAQPNHSLRDHIYDDGFLRVDREAHEVRIKGVRVPFSPKEWRLLEYLLEHKNRVMPRQSLLRHVWGDTYQADFDYLKVFVSHVRRKIQDPARHPHYIHTEREIGYRFETHN